MASVQSTKRLINGKEYNIAPYSDLSGCDLSGSYLSGSNLGWSNLSGSNLSGSNLSGSDLSGCDLSGSYLIGSNLRWSNLSGSNLRGSNLSGSNLRGSYLSDSNLSDSDLSGCDLRDCDLRGVIGNMHEIKSAQFDSWPIIWTQSPYGVTTLQIGCQRHDLERWRNADSIFIRKMHRRAMQWWDTYGQLVLALVDASPAVKWGTPE